MYLSGALTSFCHERFESFLYSTGFGVGSGVGAGVGSSVAAGVGGGVGAGSVLVSAPVWPKPSVPPRQAHT
jgi:hypothetical protein